MTRLIAPRINDMLDRMQPRRAIRIVSSTLLLLLSPAVAAAVDGHAIATRGNGKGATACAACHGENGIGLAGASFVRLAGLGEAYIAKQLHDFKSGARRNPVMQPMAAALTDEEIRRVARYYASRPRPTAPAESPGADALLRRGEELARQGLWEKDVPACFQCHGPDGQGVPPHFPSIAGQPSAYIAEQFAAWREGRRRNDPVALMQTVAERLSPDDVKAVAAFLASYQRTGKGRSP